MKKILLLAGLSLLLTACMTLQYSPGEYPIQEGRIDEFVVRGQVDVENRQTSDSKKILFDSGGAKVEGDLKSISQSLAWQLKNEITRNGTAGGSGTLKNIAVKVTFFNGTPSAFHIKSSMGVEVFLGDGKKVYINVSHGSPAGYERAMNGTIALGVIEILKNPEVLQYLSGD